jgi:hypothetical protein
MAFAGASKAHIFDSTFNDIGKNQYNFNIGCAPCLSPSFSLATFITSMVEQVQSSPEQIKALLSAIDTLLKTLDAEYKAGRLLEAHTSVALDSLQTYVDEPIR